LKVDDLMKDNILGFDVLNYDYEKLVEALFEELNGNDQHFIVNINPFIMMNFRKNEEYKRVFNQEKYQIPDGIGTVWASKFNKKIIKSRVTGIDLAEQILEKSVSENRTVFLCGAAPGVAEKCASELRKKYKDIKIVGTCDGYISQADMVKKINKSKSEIVLVGLGSPNQEKFIVENRAKLKYAKILFPVGGVIDVFSGNIKRAPKLFIKTHTEWLYRTITQPKRIWRNLSLIKFVFLVIFVKK